MSSIQPLIRRPPFTRILICILVILCVVQVGAVIRVISLPAQIAALVHFFPVFEVVAGLIWAGAFAWMAWRLIRASRCARVRAAMLITGFALYSVVRLVVFAQADYDRARLPFLGILVILLIFLVICIPLIARFISGDKRP